MINETIYSRLQSYKDFSPSERQVVKTIIDKSESILSLGIVELGAFSYTSASTVTRVCKKMGYQGFTELKKELIQDHRLYMGSRKLYNVSQPVHSDDDVSSIIDKNIRNSINALVAVGQLNSEELFSKAVSMLEKCSMLDFYGSGVSNLICHDAMFKALRYGRPVTAYAYVHEMLMSAKTSNEDNLAILVSYTGQTPEIIQVAKILKHNNVPSISITSNTNNSLRELTTINISVDSCESIHRIGGMESRMSMQLILDIIFSCYFSRSELARENIEITKLESK